MHSVFCQRTLIGFLFLIACNSPRAQCQSQTAAKPQSNQPPPAVASQSNVPQAPAWREIKVPANVVVEELVRFLDEVKKLQPTTPAQYREMQAAILEASKRILEKTPDRTTEFARGMEFDFISSSVMLMGNDGPEAHKKTFERFRDYLKAKPKPDDNDLRMALLAGQNLEQIADGKTAADGYSEFATLLKAKKSETYLAWVEMFESNARRVSLPGKEMKVAGKTITGEDFDIKSCQGKYTLVYFWASWCKTCREEYPYMNKLYLNYRDKGFEVVAVSVDEEREKLEAFLRELEVPWINLWDEENRTAPVVVQQYGISAIPTMILLDPEGKVVSMEARGLILGRLLERYIDKKETPGGTAP